MKQRFLCLLLFLILAGIYIWTNEKITFYLLMTMVIVVIFAVVSSLVAARFLSIEVRTMSQSQGEVNGAIEINLHNKCIFPIFCCDLSLRVMNLLTDSQVDIRRSYMIGPFGRETDKIMLETMFCGKVETDVIKAELRDPFSLVKKRCKAVSKGHFYIYPKDMDIISDDALKQRTHSSKMENYLGRKGNDPTEILDIRDYQRGDSVKMIHWKLSAKWKKKMVRELDMPSNQDTLLVFGIHGEPTGDLINTMAEYVLSLSKNLLLEDIHHDAVLLDKDGRLLRLYSVDGEETFGSFEKRFLEGSLSLTAEDINAYMTRHESVWRYSTIIYVSDEQPQELEDTESVIYMDFLQTA